MTYEQAQSYLLGAINETVSRRVPYRLDRMRMFLDELGNPQDAYPTIHVGGTSGKGSTSTMIASALRASGKKIGLHTKPHLKSMTERSRINGVAIDEERFAELISEMLAAIDRTAAEFGRPSYYETLLALAFVYFAREQVDLAVIEVGVGGKLDGTNVIVPQVSVITNIGLDHTDILGNTLEEIAADKSGIAKPGIPLVSAVADPGPRSIIAARCAEVGAPFILVQDTSSIEPQPSQRYGQSFALTTPSARYDLALPVLGEFQKMNAATAILALEQLNERLRPSVEEVVRGLSQLMLPGRMEFFPSHPSVVFDVAHNPDKAAHLVASLRTTFADRRFIFIIAVTDTKDAHHVLQAFVNLPASYIFTEFQTPGRTATKPQRLASIAQDLGIWGRAIASPIEALEVARRNSDASDIIVITGSTFVVAELREWWLENVRSSTP
ncbi:MAG: folylpolyglutamate synthase/dihydrofolate synthase family protein [Candidatus Baltobacteraceae bacterium]